MTVIANDTLVQLGIAMAVSLTFMLISSIAAPFRRKEDTYFAVACHFSLTATFFFCAMLKVKVLVNEVGDYLTPQLRDRFDFDEVLLWLYLLWLHLLWLHLLWLHLLWLHLLWLHLLWLHCVGAARLVPLHRHRRLARARMHPRRAVHLRGGSGADLPPR
jgi:hypothetical protein